MLENWIHYNENVDGMKFKTKLHAQRVSTCCGAKIIAGFPEGGFARVNVEDYAHDVKQWSKFYWQEGVLIIILNGSQNKWFGEMLEKEGFSLVSETKNRRSGNSLYTYLLERGKGDHVKAAR